MIITLELTIDDAQASQIIQDTALALGVQGMTDAEAIEKVRDAVRAQLKGWAVRGRQQRIAKEQEAAAAAAVSAAVSVA